MKINFCSEFNYPLIEFTPYSVIDVFQGIHHFYPDYPAKIVHWTQQGYDFMLLDELNNPITIAEFNDSNLKNIPEIKIAIAPKGQGTVGKIIGGVALLGLGLAGVGFLGISATTLTLTGASMLFSAIFKHPKPAKNTNAEKRSANFSGVVNVSGSGQQLPLAFGEVSIGSIVVSGQIVPYDSSV